MYNFCADGTTEAQCYRLETISFNSEEKIFDVLLDILKSELPTRLHAVSDCEDNPMVITEEAIDLLPPAKFSRFNVILNPLADRPTYVDSRLMRTVEYQFEAILTVSNELARCVTWELIRFKNVVEELIMSADLYIDGYNSAFIQPQGFAYSFPVFEEGVYRRQGAYRFSVTVTQNRN